MAVAAFIQPNKTLDSPSTYPANIDAALSVLARPAASFAPRAQADPDMTVRLDAGRLSVGGQLIEKAAQTTPPLVAPVFNPRQDLIVIGALSGDVAVVTGIEAASPTPPPCPRGAIPIAWVTLQPSTVAITNSAIDDVRPLFQVEPVNVVDHERAIRRARVAQALAFF